MDYGPESMTPHILPEYSRRDIVETTRVISDGDEKKVAIVNILQHGELTPAVLKLMRHYKQANTFRSVPLSNDERKSILDQEIQTLAQLKTIAPAAVPALLGRYVSKAGDHNDGYVVEFIDGVPIGTKYSAVVEPPQAAFSSFQKSIDDLFDRGLFLSEDSLAPHNLMYGTTPTISEPSIIMIEPRLIEKPDDIMRYRADMGDVLMEMYPQLARV